MASNRFRLQIIVRSVLLAVSAFLFFYLLNHDYTLSSAFILFLSVVQVVLLIKFIDKTNRDLSRFLNSIEFNDFSQNFSERNYGTSFKELHSSFNFIIQQFRKTRSEMEEHFQYLQTIVNHVRTGLIAYDRSGAIELINEAAKELLGLENILNVRQLNQISAELADTLSFINPGDKSLLKVNIKGKYHQLSVASAGFRMRAKNYTLVSLQDITSELENERLSNEMHIARVLQDQLLPKKFPDIPGYSVFAECVPALEVGGDYFDFVKLNEHKTGIVIADVSGKGLPAAFYMTLVKGIFQSYAGSSCSPKEVLTKMNSLLYKIVEKRTFITMMYAVLDHKLNKLVVARAGHEPVIRFNSDKIDLLQPKGIGLALESGEVFSKSIFEQEIDLFTGDLLLFYTDGLTDARDGESHELGIDHLLQIIHKHSRSSTKDFTESLLSEIKVFSKSTSQYDDITLITLKRNTAD